VQDLTHIAAFTRVVDSSSFTAAAKQLGMSKATVSKHVSLLEERLGTRLINRTTRRVGLTEAGARFYAHCQQIMAALAEAEDEVQRTAGMESRRLRIRAPAAFAGIPLAKAVAEFLNDQRDLALEVRFTDEAGDGREGDHDLIIEVARRDLLGGRRRFIGPLSEIICAAPGYLEARGTPLDADDIRHHACLSYAPVGDGATWRLVGDEGARTVKVNLRLASDDALILRQALLAGLGLGLVPAVFVAQELANGRLLRVLPACRSEVHCLYARDLHRGKASPIVETFLEALSARCTLPSAGPGDGRGDDRGDGRGDDRAPRDVRLLETTR
jgi:DNA-binding transcriptional LysR family regulator